MYDEEWQTILDRHGGIAKFTEWLLRERKKYPQVEMAHMVKAKKARKKARLSKLLVEVPDSLNLPPDRNARREDHQVLRDIASQLETMAAQIAHLATVYDTRWIGTFPGFRDLDLALKMQIRERFHTVGDLCCLTRRDLLAANFSRESVRRIQELLGRAGLTLRGERHVR